MINFLRRPLKYYAILCMLFSINSSCIDFNAQKTYSTSEPSSSNVFPTSSRTAAFSKAPTVIPSFQVGTKSIETPQPISSPTTNTIQFAVIGDYGEGNQGEQDVANLVKSWKPDFIITTGDNNYPDGSKETIDQNIGRFYHEFIFPYFGAYGQGGDQMRFFPTLGNHDWTTDRAQPYLEYFVLPGNERYYDFIWGAIHLFALDSDSREPDGVSANSVQAQWLQKRLARSSSTWKLVYFHHPPYSSGLRGPVDWMRWPFREWGATAVLAGHDHFYERLEVDGLPYIINGIGGGPIYEIGLTAPGSIVRYNDDYGAMLIIADESHLVFRLINRQGVEIDEYQILR